MKKSQLNTKLDEDMRNTIKNYQAIDVDIFDYEDNNTHDKREES